MPNEERDKYTRRQTQQKTENTSNVNIFSIDTFLESEPLRKIKIKLTKVSLTTKLEGGGGGLSDRTTSGDCD